jgi:NAD-dependent protein deacetylase/lipoamidase
MPTKPYDSSHMGGNERGAPVAGGDPGVARAARLVEEASTVVALTGAGISTESGIPDFRGPHGVWTRDPKAERMATLDVYLSDPDVRRRSWQHRLTSPTWSAAPNAGHLALADLERAGKLRAVITQNIDELHQRAGNDPTRVVELHGTMRSVRCWSCGDRTPMEDVLERVKAGEDDPSCLAGGGGCGGILKSATISFGESLDPEVMGRAELEVTTGELLLVVGSSLVVHPAAGLVPAARRTGARLVIVNAEETPYDPIADLVVRGPIGEVLPAMLEALYPRS